jgi:surface antigen
MATFEPRIEESPSTSNAYYFRDNPYYQNGVGLPNCTCYAFGRVYEITGTYPDLPTGSNAAKWYDEMAGIYDRGKTPKLGAVICWEGGEEGWGHVAVVEEVKDNGDIVYSESWFDKKYFGSNTTTASSGYFFQSEYRFQGFIYCCEEFDNSTSGASSNSSIAYQILNPTSRKMTTTVDEKLIWQFLILKIQNPYGVAGLMGNLYHESALSSINLEGQYESSLGYSDTEYTIAVDTGDYDSESFITDRAGYGLAQWTHDSRKRKLYNYKNFFLN